MSDHFESGPDLYVRTHKVTGIPRGWTDIAQAILADDSEWGPITHYVAFGQVRQARQDEAVGVHELLQQCRPHVAMSKSVTSGRDFQETAQALLDKIDRELR